MQKLVAKRSFTGDEKEGFVKRNSVFETTDARAKTLQEINLAIPYEEPKAKQEKQADKQTKEEKTAYQTKEEKVSGSDTKKKPGPKSKK